MNCHYFLPISPAAHGGRFSTLPWAVVFVILTSSGGSLSASLMNLNVARPGVQRLTRIFVVGLLVNQLQAGATVLELQQVFQPGEYGVDVFTATGDTNAVFGERRTLMLVRNGLRLQGLIFIEPSPVS
jgi:hypothetical protein